MGRGEAQTTLKGTRIIVAQLGTDFNNNCTDPTKQEKLISMPKHIQTDSLGASGRPMVRGQGMQASKSRADPAEGARGPAMDCVYLRCFQEEQDYSGSQITVEGAGKPDAGVTDSLSCFWRHSKGPKTCPRGQTLSLALTAVGKAPLL